MHQTQNDNARVQRINDALVEKIMGWRPSGTRYYISSRKYVTKRSFDPMRDWCSTLSLIQHARVLNPGLTGELLFKGDATGAMTFSAYVRIWPGQTGRASRHPWASMALAEALANAYGISAQGGAQ